MSWTIFIQLPSCSGPFIIPVNNFPDHLVNVLDHCSYDAILLQDIYGSCEQFPRPSGECPGLFLYHTILLRAIYDFCPSHLVNDLDYCSYNTILLWVPVNNFPDHLVNVLDHFVIITILLLAIGDSCESFPGPSCRWCGLFSYNYHLTAI